MTNSFQMKCIDFLTTIETTYFASYRTLVLHDCCPISFSAYTILYDEQLAHNLSILEPNTISVNKSNVTNNPKERLKLLCGKISRNQIENAPTLIISSWIPTWA